MEQTIMHVLSELEQIGEALYTDESSGYLQLSMVLPSLQQVLSVFLDMFSANGDEASDAWCADVRGQLQDLEKAVTYRDTVGIADILEYRIANVLQELLQIMAEAEE